MGRKVVRDGVRVEALLSREEHEYVKRFAAATGLSVSAVLRVFVTRSLDAVRDHLGGVPSVQTLSDMYRIELAEIEMKENSDG